ncbi:hypothetical protein GGS21DRAFT_492157 [Xylaria nigripes]|nr:hypothetical protein GGS21DRAFT_492157 [Xylaria nigripes]
MVALKTLATLSAVLAITSSKPLNTTKTAAKVIPVSEVGCWYSTLAEQDVADAKALFEEWGRHHHIRGGSMYGERSGRAAIWICNCKHFKPDHVVPEELDEAMMLIAESCGHNGTGWVWSRKWQKSINLGIASKMADNRFDSDKCPHFCTWGVWHTS